MAKLLITGALQRTKRFNYEIAQLDYEIIFVQNELEVLLFDPLDIEVVICNGLFLYNDISKFTSLKYIQTTSAGLDRLPMEQIKERGIVVKNARGVYSVPMAEWSVTAILSLYKNMSLFIKNQMQKRWLKDRELRELSGSRALIVGMGSVGQQVAQRLWALGVMVSGVDIVNVQSYYIDKCFDINDLKGVVGDYDIVVITMPLTPDTYHIMGANVLGKLKKDSIIINISRGAIIDESSLIASLKSGRIRGAALDVFEDEPLSVDSPLWGMESVIITPHNSFVSDKNQDRLENLIIENLERYYDQK